MIVLIILTLVIFLLAILPLGASVIYNHEGAEVRLIAGLIRFRIFPKKKARKPKKEKAKKEKKPRQMKTFKSKPDSEPKKGGSLKDFIPLIRIGFDCLNDFRKKIRVNRLEMKLIMAGDDPCDLALNYSRAWTALGNLIPRLESFLTIKKRDLQVECDFTADETTVFAYLNLTITLGRLTVLGFRYGFRALKEFMKINKLRKGGAVQ